LLGTDDDLEPVASMVEGPDGDTDEDFNKEDFDPEDIPDPESIPESLTGPEMRFEDDFGMGLGKKIAIGVVILIFAILGGVIFAKNQIIGMVPAVAPVYAALDPVLGMLDFGGHDVGEGLDLKDIKYEPEVVNGKDFLTVKGKVTNTTDKRQVLPVIRITLGDAEGHPITSVDVRPIKQSMRAHETISFSSKKFEKPGIARKVNINFIDPESKDNKEKKPAADDHGKKPAAH